MSTATVEEFQSNPAKLLAAVERGDQVIISRGEKAVARLLPVADDVSEEEHEEWGVGSMENLGRAYGIDEPDYDPSSIVEPNPHYRP